MKYSDKSKPMICMMTQSTCYKGTNRMAIKGVLWHSTGANNPNLKRYVQPDDNVPDHDVLLQKIGKNAYNNDWNHAHVEAGLNAWIGKLADGSVATVQNMPWDYRPWGCGSGYKGSCNDGWIQFEICEDNLNDKSYFSQVYREACELTAYLCKLYSINPKGKVNHNGVAVPTILCHADSYNLGLGSNHGDVLHWFSRYGKTMDVVRNDVDALIHSVDKPNTSNDQLYRVRKSWADSKTQKGAYRVFDNAKKCADENPGYKVFDYKGNIVYEPKRKGITELAKEVINGKWGNGAERKRKLTEAGYDYAEIQKEVNRLLR
jgi:hypothetical protein